MLELYASGKSMKKISSVVGIGQYTLRRMFIAEGLAIKVRDRKLSLEAYNNRRAVSPEEVTQKFEDVTCKPIEQSTKSNPNATSNPLYRKLEVTEKALQRARDELNYRRAITRKEARNETLVDKVEKIISEAANNVSVGDVTIEVDIPLDVPEQGLIAVFSDVHVGEVVGDDVPGNTYDYAVMNKRVDTFISKVLHYHKQSEMLVICDLKDMLKGVIHGGIYESEGSFIESITEAINVYVRMYKTFAKQYKQVVVFSTGSNHDRVHDNIVTTDKHLDYGRLMDSMVIKVLEAAGINNVTINTTDNGYHMFSVNKANIVAFHGDTLRTYKPTSTVSRSKLQDTCLQLFNAPYRHAISGHTHEYVACGNQFKGLSIVNGTMVGNTSYGLQSGYADILASQTICFVEEDGSIEDITAVQFNN